LNTCPFCASKVHVDLITFGGPCPSCFGDIPGEEAATDPGEEVKAAQKKQDDKRSYRKAVLPLLLATPVVMLLAVVAVWLVLKPEPQMVLLDFDEFDEYPMPELVAKAPEVVDTPDPKTASTPRAQTPSGTQLPYAGGTNDIGTGEGGTNLQGDGVATATGGTRGTRTGIVGPSGGPSDGGKLDSSGGQEAGLDFGIGVNAARRGAVLDDPEAIKRMIGQKMAAQVPRLNSCYESQLKTDESLQGRWRLAFVVSKDGKALDTSATGLNEQSAEFEACLSRELAKWSFQRIKHDQPVRKTVTFRPG
jgi:hypothetical protein